MINKTRDFFIELKHLRDYMDYMISTPKYYGGYVCVHKKDDFFKVLIYKSFNQYLLSINYIDIKEFLSRCKKDNNDVS